MCRLERFFDRIFPLVFLTAAKSCSILDCSASVHYGCALDNWTDQFPDRLALD